MLKMDSVKTKIIVLVLSCIVLSSAAVGGASILNARRVVDADSEQIMDLMCRERSEELNSLIRRIEQPVKTLALYATQQLGDMDRFRTDPVYVEEYTQSLLDVAINSAQNTEGALTVYIRFNPKFTDSESGFFWCRSPSGGTFQSLPPTDLAAYAPSDTEHVGWYYKPAQNEAATWMPPYFNENIQTEMISYVVPYYADNELVGVVGMDIEFRMLQDIIAKTSVYESGYAFLTNENAAVIYHRDLPRGTDLLEYNRGEFREMAELLRAGQQGGNGLIQYTYRDTEKKASFRILVNGMRLVLTAPTTEIDQQAHHLLVQIAGAVILVIAFSVIITVFFTRRLVKPLLELTTAARKIAAGDLSVSITHQSRDEVGTLAESFRQTVAHLHRYISYINELAYRDSLTGVKNKTAYLEAERQWDEQIRLKRPQFGVVVFDINGLKSVNDTCGHDFGDMLIRSSCKIICTVFKRSPVYRIGGDEFVVILEEEDYRQYQELLCAMEAAVREYNDAPQDGLRVSVARGIALFSEETDLTYNDVFRRADSAMYHNKIEMKEKRG